MLSGVNFFSRYLNRYQSYFVLYILFLLISSVTRLGLTVWSFSEIDFSFFNIVLILLTGWLYDTVFFLYASIPLIFLYWLVPEKIWHSRIFNGLIKLWVIITIYILCFIVVSEFIFWDEFQVRFNFISVDYLVYRKEVMDNINESYPVLLILILMVPVSLLIAAGFRRVINKTLNVSSKIIQRTGVALTLLLFTLLAYNFVDQSQFQSLSNNYNRQLAANGPYQFFAAFRNNQLDYDYFYKQIDRQLADKVIRDSLDNQFSNYLYPDEIMNIGRYIDNPGTEKKLNVILVSIESMSAKYLGAYGNKGKLTPFMDKLAKESLFFTDFFATGTRTTRGLEAITLSIPPTPGRSIIKRIGSEGDMWSLGNVLKSKGYQTTFIYGGRGYFDNMNSFFSKNGYDIVDQTDIPDNEVKFSNAWGVSDEDLYEETIKQADNAFKKNTPFFFHLMTTSNHRPYTYPDNKIDIPSGDGREGSVKYTDFALKRFINRAKTRPWFKDTIFVITADHCSGSAGKVDLPVGRYHIPLMIYGPDHIQQKIITQRYSQIDIAPTILGLLNMDYNSWFFGQDMLKDNGNNKQLALISNYQYLGMYLNKLVTILKPKKEVDQYLTQEKSSSESLVPLFEQQADINKTIAYYQTAAYLLKNKINSWSRNQKQLPHNN